MKKKTKFYVAYLCAALFLLVGVFFFFKKEASAIQKEKSMEEELLSYNLDGYVCNDYIGIMLYGDGRQETIVDGVVVKTENVPE